MPVQRWRLIVARAADAPDLNQRDLGRAWDRAAAALADAGPAPAADPPRVVLGAPVPSGMAVDADLVDLLLPMRLTITDVRSALAGRMPDGWSLVNLHDVWVGEPALPAAIVAADYRVAVRTLVDDLASERVDRSDSAMPRADDLARAVTALLRADAIDRTRTRPGRPAGGNLRPLIESVRVAGPGDLWMRLRFDPVLGTGRPEEVVVALGLLAGRAYVAVRSRRERLWLRTDQPSPPPDSAVGGDDGRG
jgi:hypothetical protein